MSVVIEVGLRLRDQFVHTALTSESADKHADVLLAVQRKKAKAAEVAMRALIEKSIEDVEIAKTMHAPDQESAASWPAARDSLQNRWRPAEHRDWYDMTPGQPRAVPRLPVTGSASRSS
jgi:hypothetical protein